MVLRPEPGDKPKVHVDLFAQGGIAGQLRLAVGNVEDIANVVAEDAAGKLDVTIAGAPPGVTAEFRRPTNGAWHLSYDVRATSNPGGNTYEVVVAEDRFRALGERIYFLPTGMENTKVALTVAIDGKAIVAPRSASSLGIGQKTREGYGRTLVRAAFLAGSLGGAMFDEGIDHDETVWMGYSAFDPRPASAEVATVRSALREMWHGGGDEEFILLFVSSTRPLGAYSLVPRAGSLLVHLGPSEPWSASLRVGIAQHLMRTWIGGELRFAPREGATEAESLWFTDGFARYFAARALRRLGLLSVEDARDFVNGLISAQATSPYRGKNNATVAALAATTPIARAHLMAHGALYAARLAASIRARTKGEHSLDTVVAKLVERARSARAPLPLTAFTDAITAELGEGEQAQFDKLIHGGEDVVLAADGIGPCFRGAPGDYTAFDLGFDLQETLDGAGRTIAGLAAGGPAAKAGLLTTDVLDDVTFRHGHAEVPVALKVLRNGQKVDIQYAPRGPRGKGVIFTRKANMPDLACGDVL
ncbi:MAG: hypothetical protein ABW133_11550 [Polyangiaceae bacterium]